MFTFRNALGRGLLFLVISPALTQADDGSETQFSPFHNSSISSFDEVWREPISDIERRFSGVALHPIELVESEEVVAPFEGDVDATTQVADSPSLFPTLTAQPSETLLQRLHPTDTIRAAETSLFHWMFGMLGVVGLLALGGVYWIIYIRPALDVRHTTGRLRLSSTLSLPRRSGLFLVDVEDQTVLVAMDGGGIRQVVPLGLGTSMKTIGRRAADKAQRASLPSTSEGAAASGEVAFHHVYQEQRALGEDVRAVLSAAKCETRPQTAAVHSSTAH